MAVVKLVLTKDFTWRGRVERWSNGYHFQVNSALSRDDFIALGEAIWTGVESRIIAAENVFTNILGYNNPDGVADASINYPGLGQTGLRAGANSYTGAATNLIHPEQCWLIKANVGLTVKGRANYLRKYYHPIRGPLGDSVASHQAGINPVVTKLIDGTLPSAARLCSPRGVVATGIGLDPYMRVHQLKRRGKRPTRA